MGLAHQFGVTTVKFQPFSEIFLINRDEGKNFFCSQRALEEIKLSVEKVIELSKKYKIATNPTNYLYSIPLYLCGLGQRYSHNNCSALWSSCPISAEGNVHLCWVLSDRLLGNVKKTKLSKIWNSEEHNRLRQLVIKEGCPGCLMSCYDYNFDEYEFRHLLYFKAKKLKKPKFYKRLYYRVYQYLRYILRKIINRIANLYISQEKDNSDETEVLEKITIAKDMFKREFKILKKDE
jgi:radical SAM protein with 4Fe4S-binding SPASM domain